MASEQWKTYIHKNINWDMQMLQYSNQTIENEVCLFFKKLELKPSFSMVMQADLAFSYIFQSQFLLANLKLST